MRKIIISLILLYAMTVNFGCVALFAAGAITGAGQYLKYSMDGIVNQTFIGDLDHLTLASIDTLDRMEMNVENVERKKKWTRIYAQTKNLEIKINLDPISDNTTKVSINVSKYTVLKDKATASAIISQINFYLTEKNRRLARSAIK